MTTRLNLHVEGDDQTIAMFVLQMDSFLKLGEEKKLIQYRLHTQMVDDIVEVVDKPHINRAVTGRLRSMSLELEKYICRLHVENGLDRYQIAKELNINYDTVRKVLGKHGLNPKPKQPMTEADVHEAVEMFTKHEMSASCIAHKLGWSVQTVCNHLHKVGVMARLTSAEVHKQNVERQSNSLRLAR